MPQKKQKKPKPPKETHVAAHLPTDNQELYTHCEASWTQVQADTTHFVNVSPPPAQITSNLAKLSSSLLGAEGGEPAAIVALDAAAADVRADGKLLAAYVESVVRLLPPATAAVLIANVLMYVSETGKRAPKAELDVKQGALSGSVNFIALAVATATMYYYDYSVDGLNWSTVQSHKTRASLAGLTAGKLYYFRLRAYTRRGGLGAPSQTVNLMVI